MLKKTKFRIWYASDYQIKKILLNLSNAFDFKGIDIKIN